VGVGGRGLEVTAALGLWLEASRRSCDMQVEQIPRSRSKEWIFDGRRLRHTTGGFNTDARSVLASGPWRLLASAGTAPFRRWRDHGGLGESLLNSYEAPEERGALPTADVIERLQRLRRTADFVPIVVDLADLQHWEITDTAIAPTRRAGFTISHFSVSTTEREVTDWDQPLVASSSAAQVAHPRGRSYQSSPRSFPATTLSTCS
jgi:hypothetical protein